MDHQKHRQLQHEASESLLANISLGARFFVEGIISGITGIFVQPIAGKSSFVRALGAILPFLLFCLFFVVVCLLFIIFFFRICEGAHKSGTEGFLKGIGRGALSVLTKPTLGVVDLAYFTLEGIRR